MHQLVSVPLVGQVPICPQKPPHHGFCGQSGLLARWEGDRRVLLRVRPVALPDEPLGRLVALALGWPVLDPLFLGDGAAGRGGRGRLLLQSGPFRRRALRLRRRRRRFRSRVLRLPGNDPDLARRRFKGLLPGLAELVEKSEASHRCCWMVVRREGLEKGGEVAVPRRACSSCEAPGRREREMEDEGGLDLWSVEECGDERCGFEYVKRFESLVR